MIFQSSTNNRMAKEGSAFLPETWCRGTGQKMDFPNSDRWETIAAKWKNKTKQKTQAINTKPMTNVTDPKSQGNSNEQWRKSCWRDLSQSQGGQEGDFRISTIIEQSWESALDWSWSSCALLPFPFFLEAGEWKIRVVFFWWEKSPEGNYACNS